MSRSKKNWDRLVQHDGNYGIDIANGIWPGSGITQKGEEGPKGEPGQKGERGLQGPDGPKGKEGPTGADGPQGDDGSSAFDVAVKGGFVGTEAEWLETLKGQKGQEGDKGETGVFGDLTEDEKDRLKGDQGIQGEKGEASGIFHFKGKEDDFTSIEALPGPHEEGDVYQAADTEDLYVWDGGQFVLLSEALDVVKGQKGEAGENGTDGDKGEQGERGFRGQKGMEGVQGEVGDSAYDIAVKGGFGGTETEWVESLKGDDGVKGDEGAKGDQGDSAYDISQKGIDPASQLTEDEWLESLKGQKGENYDPLVLDDYYDKTQVDQLLDALPDPDDSYDIDAMPPENTVGPGDNGDFLDEDPSHFLYNPGLIAVKSGANISNSPAAAPFVVRNVVLNNPAGLRGSEYTVMQEVVAVSTGSSTSYIRTAQPGSASFSPWSESTFDSDSYYNKTEVDGLVNAINYVLDHDAAKITLTDKDSVEQSVQLVGTNGIAVTSDAAGIVIDGAALTPVPQFLGILEDGQDPAALSPTPTSGQYYIIGYEGVTISTDPDAQACTPGDWVIYDTDKWVFLDISSDPGVVSVTVSGLLDIEDSDVANPVIGLDPAAVVTPDELEEYVEKDDLAKVMTSIFVNDLADVEISYTRVPFAGSASRAVYALNAGETETPTDGERSSNIQTNTLYLAQTSSSGQGSVEFYNNINTAADPPQIIRVSGTGTGIGAGDQRTGRCVSKSSDGSVLTLVFETANIPLFAQGCPGEVTFDIVTEDLDHGAVLTYDNTSQMWKAGEAADYVKKTGDTMTGTLSVNARDSVADEEVMFSIGGEQAAGGAGTNLLQAIRKASNGDQIRYYGPQTFDKEIATVGFLSDGFLPLTGGSLQGDIKTATLTVRGSAANTGARDNIFVVKSKDNDDNLRLVEDGNAFFRGGVGSPALFITDPNSGDAISLSKTGSDTCSIDSFVGEFQIQTNGLVKLGIDGSGGFLTTGPDSYEEVVRWNSEFELKKSLRLRGSSGDEGDVMLSKGGGEPPEWTSGADFLGGLDHNFLMKPYTVYTGDAVGDLTPEAPDGNFHDGELYYSTSTNELFVYGGGNWWPTAVDWQADITRIDTDLGFKLSKDRDNIVADGFNIKKADGENLIKWDGSELSVRNVAEPSESTDVATKNYVDQQVNNTSETPIGSIIFWGGTIAKIPTGWVECRGQPAPSSVQSFTGFTNIPDLRNYMPAGAGGAFGSNAGSYVSSKIKSHSHTVSRLEPGSTQGNPDGAGDSSTGRYRYWRGNASSTGSSGSTISRASSSTGDSITAPPVYLGVYIMKVS